MGKRSQRKRRSRESINMSIQSSRASKAKGNAKAKAKGNAKAKSKTKSKAKSKSTTSSSKRRAKRKAKASTTAANTANAPDGATSGGVGTSSSSLSGNDAPDGIPMSCNPSPSHSTPPTPSTPVALAFIATLTNDPSDRHVFVSFQDTFYHQKGGTLQDVSQHVCGKGPNSAPGNRGTVSKW